MQKEMYSVHRLRRSQSKHRLWKKKIRTPCVACWLHQSGAWEGFGQEEEKKRKTHSSLHMGRLSYGELPTRAVQRGACFTYSPKNQHAGFSLSLSLCRLTRFGWEPASEQRKREEGAWQTSKPAETGWTTVLIMDLQSQRCYLCASWES